MEHSDNIQLFLAEILEQPLETIGNCSDFYKKKTVSKHEFLLQEGEICRETIFVESGLLRMYSVDQQGKEHIIQFAPEKWLISDRSSLFFKEKSKYFIDAIEDSEVYLLSRHFFNKLYSQSPNVGINNEILLQKHVQSLQNRINSLLADTAEQRYLSFIKMYPDILQRVPQWMVASYLGIMPESLSRVRRELARKSSEA